MRPGSTNHMLSVNDPPRSYIYLELRNKQCHSLESSVHSSNMHCHSHGTEINSTNCTVSYTSVCYLPKSEVRACLSVELVTYQIATIFLNFGLPEAL